jgi:Sulfotransferase family
MSDEKPKVVYVMGAGRSGSTILGVALGNCRDVFYAGELHLWLGKAGKSPLHGAERARFWSMVAAEVGGRPDLSSREARSLEQSTALFRPSSWSPRRTLRRRYRRFSEDLYRAIAHVAGATHVVDTSHFPRRARELQKLEGVELHLLFLVRSPQKVVASYSRDDTVFPRFNLLTTNVYLWLTYLLSVFVFLRHPRERRLFVSYESFLSDPQSVLREILDRVGSSADTPDLSALDTGLAFQGNDILRSEVLAFGPQPDRPWRGSRATALLNLPWRAVFSRLRPSVGVTAAAVVEPSRTPGA